MSEFIRFLPRAGLALVLMGATLAACSPRIDHHGYQAKPGAFGQIDRGMPRTEVEGLLGSPSTTASVNFDGDSSYYITSVTQTRSFLKPKEVQREVIAVRFNQQDQVESFAQYGLDDGQIIDMNSRQTPVTRQEMSILRDLFKGMLGSKPTF